MLDQPAVQAFIARATKRSYPPRQAILHAGDEPSSLFLILEGSMSVIVHDDDGCRSPRAISIVVAQSQRVEGLGGPRRVTAHIWTPIGKTRARLSSSLARRRRSKKIKGQTAAPSCPRCGIRWLPNAPF